MVLDFCKSAIICSVRFIPLWTFFLAVVVLKALQSLFIRVFRRRRAGTLSQRTRIAMASAGKYVAARRMGAAMVAGVAVAAVATLRSGKGDVGSLKALLKSVVTGPGSTSRIVAILVVLANFKNLPLVWHVSTPRDPG
jgi:hypothetical protein